MNNSFGETYTPQPISLAEQARIDRQMFDQQRTIRDERKSHEILAIIGHSVDERYSWLRTEDPVERAALAQGILAIKQHQQSVLLEKHEYPTGPETYRALQYRHQTDVAIGTAVLVAEAIMGGDTLKGTIPIFAEQSY